MTMLKLGLLGSGISHSKMPRLQHYLGQLTGTEIDYVLIDGLRQHSFDPAEKIRNAISSGFGGLNVTHPYKQQIYQLVTSPYIKGHELIGSYNTLLPAGNNILGANTDYSGFIKAYKNKFGRHPPGQVFLCGAGGVGRAVAMGLKELGCTDLKLFDPVHAQAESLARALEKCNVNVEIVSTQNKESAILKADGLANCTAIGMHSNPGSAIDLSLVDKQAWAFDAVYTPLDTEFLSHCRQSAIPCLSGFDLWLYQGLDAFKIFTGTEIEVSQALKTETLSWLD